MPCEQPAMHIHRSNRTEHLLDALAGVVSQPLGDPLAPECIVVQSRGMERWVALQLARRFGVWANGDFPFPRHLIERAFRAVDAAPETVALWSSEGLRWAIAIALKELRDSSEFEPLQRYMQRRPAVDDRLALASQIAQVFDQYLIYRPEMILRWEQGEQNHWQAQLWRALVARYGRGHCAAQAQALVTHLDAGGALPASFPTRVSLFGVATLAPLYLEILRALAGRIDVHLFVLAPTREYWADTRSARELDRALRRGSVSTGAYVEQGHPWLASVGRLGREFQELLEQRVPDYQEPDTSLFVEPSGTTLLETLQRDMLDLVERDGARAERLPLPPADESIAVHACHSAMREVEVVHEQILDALHRDSTLRPEDIVVLVADISRYGPLAEAVFGAGPLPFHVADRSEHTSREPLAAFLRVLEVGAGRLGIAEVLDLLSFDCIRERFGMSLDDVATASEWLRDAAVRWGADATHRAAVGQPEVAENSWRFGLDRLLLGHAIEEDRGAPLGGVMPYDAPDSERDLLAACIGFGEAVLAAHAALSSAKPLALWRDVLETLLASFIAEGESGSVADTQLIRESVAALAEQAARAGFDEPVSATWVRRQLHERFSQRTAMGGFLRGGVTVCEIAPMRAIPFRMVCVLGLDGETHPRAHRPVVFDLMAEQPQPGDRSVRDDDRYAFLECVLAARARLVLTYVGQSIRDNTPQPASVVLEELLDVLGEMCAPPGQTDALGPDAIRERLVARHPLQAYSTEYFQPSRPAALVSFDQASYRAALAAAATDAPEPSLLQAPLVPPAVEELAVERLAKFVEHPVRSFLENQLGWVPAAPAGGLEQREPAALAGLEQWRVGTQLNDAAMAEQPEPQRYAALRARGWLPWGRVGEQAFEVLNERAEALVETFGDADAHALPPLEIDARLAGIRLVGLVRPIGQTEYATLTFSKVRAERLLRLWVYHLLLNWRAPTGYPRQSRLVGRDEKTGEACSHVLKPVLRPEVHLRELLELYHEGQRYPLPLPPNSGLAYARARFGGSPAAKKSPLQQARECFEGNKQHPGEGQRDAYLALALAGESPFEPDGRPFANALSGCVEPAPASFASLAERVWQPLWEHWECIGRRGGAP